MRVMRLWAVVLTCAWAGAAGAAVVDEPITQLAVAPGGRALVLGARGDLWVWDGRAAVARRLTTEGGIDPCFDTTGRWVYYASRRGDNTDLYRIAVPDARRGSRALPDGGRPQRLTHAAAAEIQPAPSPDGKTLACARYDQSHYSIFLIRDGSAERIIATTAQRRRPRWSPSGDMLAYERVRGGGVQTLLYDLASRRERILPATASEQPAFRDDGSLWALLDRRLCRLDPHSGNVLETVEGPINAFAWADNDVLYCLRQGHLHRREGGRETLCEPRLEWNPADEYRRDVRFVAREHYGIDRARERLWERYARAHQRPIVAATTSREYDARMAELFWNRPSARAPVSGRQYLIAAARDLAARSGERMLERGGNAVDAAVATGFTMGVVDPDGSGIGGEGLINLHLVGMREPVIIDCRSMAPLRINPDQPGMRGADGDWIRYGPKASCTPGLVAGYYHAWQHYGSGKIPWAELVADAIHYASEGFPVTPRQVRELTAFGERLARDPECRRVFVKADGQLWKPGELLKNPELAWTLTRIAQHGRDGFYAGEVAARLDAYMRKHGGIMRADDLLLYRAVERTPISVEFRGLRAYGSGPPSCGSIALFSMLTDLNRRPRLAAPYATDPATFISLARIMRSAYRDMSRVADPRFWDTPVDALLAPSDVDGGHTTNLTVMDASGNAMVLTQTLSHFFGSQTMVEGTGILLNNELQNFGTDISEPDYALPLARVATTPCPTLFFVPAANGPGEVVTAIGSAGGPAIPSSVFTTLVGRLEYGKDPQAAVELPRFLVPGGDRRRLSLEDLFAPAVEDAVPRQLGVKSYTISQRGLLNEAFCNLICRDPSTGALQGGVDCRRDGAVVGR